MYASIDFATKKDFRSAVQRGLPITLYSPTLGMPAINGTVTVEGPWPSGCSDCSAAPATHRARRIPAWKARVEVRNMQPVQVH